MRKVLRSSAHGAEPAPHALWSAPELPLQPFAWLGGSEAHRGETPAPRPASFPALAPVGGWLSHALGGSDWHGQECSYALSAWRNQLCVQFLDMVQA